MDKDIYGGVADSRPLSREKCHATQAGSPRKEKQARKNIRQGVYKEKWGGNWRKIGEEVGEK